VNTNGHGYLLNPGRDVAAELRAAGVDKVSVSLNAGDKETYTDICKPTFAEAYETVIDFIQKAKPMLHVEVTAIRMPEVDIAKAKAVADGLNVKFRIREYIPCFH
jgi:TatD family-associated radical SAM protein